MKTTTGPCVTGPGKPHNNGYTRKRIGGIQKYAHTISWEVRNGSVPVGMVIDHLCRNRACVNVDHLEPVPSKINTLRGVGPTAIHAAKTKCVNGHLFNAENTYLRPAGNGRDCKECGRARCRKKYALARKPKGGRR